MVRVAVGLWLGLALLGLLSGGYLWLLRSEVRTAVIARNVVRPEQVEDAVTSVLMSNTVVALLFAAAYSGFALALRAGRRWARVALSAVAALQLVLLVLSGLGSVANLVSIVLVVAALVVTWHGATSRWLAEKA
ncbi:hypothetical protein GCM10010174_88240 [Kutzneria viridogrisea]|uniref:Uncharacterized protein n=2 Tax=Kutzneria TaxID=43356 RepID=W5WLR0_9PSEU|nr:hypothetical protein [Kutzneria albida]AHI01701.1 hypothetical protein KALB_8344 [Kutzneria albida DSM 43870]MBA8931664.1 hypothetical protein [Kutzneria viridogrisea]